MKKKQLIGALLTTICVASLIGGCGKTNTASNNVSTTTVAETAAPAASSIDITNVPVIEKDRKAKSLIYAWHYTDITSGTNELRGGYKYNVPANDALCYEGSSDKRIGKAYIMSDFSTSPTTLKVACGFLEEFNLSTSADDYLNTIVGNELNKLGKTSIDGVINVNNNSFYVVKGNMDSTFQPGLISKFITDYNLEHISDIYTLYFKCPKEKSVGVIEIMMPMIPSMYSDNDYLATVYDIASKIVIN